MGTVPAVAVPVRHHCVLVAEPAVDHGVRRFRPVDKKRRVSLKTVACSMGDQAGRGRGASTGRLASTRRTSKEATLAQASQPPKLSLQTPAWGAAQLEPHQMPWLQHAHEGTQGHMPLVSRDPGWSGQRANRDQAPGPPALPTRLRKWCSLEASRWKEPSVLHRRKVPRSGGPGGGGAGTRDSCLAWGQPSLVEGPEGQPHVW